MVSYCKLLEVLGSGTYPQLCRAAVCSMIHPTSPAAGNAILTVMQPALASFQGVRSLFFMPGVHIP